MWFAQCQLVALWIEYFHDFLGQLIHILVLRRLCSPLLDSFSMNDGESYDPLYDGVGEDSQSLFVSIMLSPNLIANFLHNLKC